MLTLFIDTHSNLLKLSLISDRVIANICLDEVISSKVCMPSLVRLFSLAHKDVSCLSDIVVVNGPGSFTGERLGVVIAKTMAYCLDIPIRVISSFEVYLPIDYVGYLVMSEKNGYYLAYCDGSSLSDYGYIVKKDFASFDKDYKLVGDYDVLKAVRYARGKEPTNCHNVNPFYVKKIEVLK